MAANSALPLPEAGWVFVSVAQRDRKGLLPIARGLAELGYTMRATRGTAGYLREHGIEVAQVHKLKEGRPNLLDHMKNKEVSLVVNTPSGRGARTDEGQIRAAAVLNGVTCITTLAAAEAAVEACRAMRERNWTVRALQDWYPRCEG
jgi:carbamoyl-phosphate synthase large subunit